MTCKETIDLLADYLESALDDQLIEQLETHLRDCGPCVAYLNTYRRTRELAGDAGRVDMPEEMKARLRRFLLNALDRRS
jgi:hypothetical protein